jgi:hypothetical protein
MRRVASLIIAACFALPLAAHAQGSIELSARTAGELAALCGANPREATASAKINFCHGFAQGVVTVELQKAGTRKPFCFPTPAPTRSATLAQFVAWVRGAASRRDLAATDGLMQFLGERYPCR